MNIYYVQQTERQTTGPSLWDMGCEQEDTLIFHIIHAHNEQEAARIFNRSCDEYYMLDDQQVTYVGPSWRTKQGFAGRKKEEHQLLDFWQNQERTT
jgi:hypothetical protein